MPKISVKRQELIRFWNKNKDELCQERSIKKVYSSYKGYCEEQQSEVTNEYIFRTYIRKNGYCNSKAT